jgi:tetratricopeptide (TPR) repeat protein
LYGLTLALIGCTGSPPPRPRSAQTTRVQPVAAPEVRAVERLPATIITPTTALDVSELFVVGQTFLRQGQPEQAAEAFDSILEHDPAGPLAERALFQGALARESDRDLEGAAQRFEELARRFPRLHLAEEALVRSMRLRLHEGRWDLAGDAAQVFLERYAAAAAAVDRILAFGARGLGLLAAGRQEDAEYAIEKGLHIIDELELDRAGRIPRDLAVAYFALGEARRRRAEATRVSPVISEFAATLERRCELLLSAQSAYSDTMRAHDAHWSAIAGYRVGELYQRLHDELTAIPAPEATSERQRLLFEGAMRLRYSVLLNKASSMMEHTLSMAERTGEESEWVRRAATSRVELQRAAAAEQSALDRLPFTREDLQRALDDLSSRANSPSPVPSHAAPVGQ